MPDININRTTYLVAQLTLAETAGYALPQVILEAAQAARTEYRGLVNKIGLNTPESEQAEKDFTAIQKGMQLLIRLTLEQKLDKEIPPDLNKLAAAFSSDKEETCSDARTVCDAIVDIARDKRSPNKAAATKLMSAPEWQPIAASEDLLCERIAEDHRKEINERIINAYKKLQKQLLPLLEEVRQGNIRADSLQYQGMPHPLDENRTIGVIKSRKDKGTPSLLFNAQRTLAAAQECGLEGTEECQKWVDEILKILGDKGDSLGKKFQAQVKRLQASGKDADGEDNYTDGKGDAGFVRKLRDAQNYDEVENRYRLPKPGLTL